MGQKPLWKLALLVMVLAGLLFNADTPAQAQDDDQDQDDVLVEITGRVESLDDEEVIIDGMIVAPAGAFRPSALEVGDCVLLTGILLEDDVIKAVSLDLSEDCQDDDGDDNNGDDGDDGDDGDEPTGCDRLDHPVLTVYAEEFKVDYTDLAAYHCDGVGLGEIGRALLLADAAGADYKALLAERADGVGWGAIKKEYDINPSDLAPGQVISGSHMPPGQEGKDKDNPGQDDDEDADDDQGQGNGKDKDNPGQGGTPPGQDKDKDKDKDKDNQGGGKKK